MQYLSHGGKKNKQSNELQCRKSRAKSKQNVKFIAFKQLKHLKHST